MSAGSRASAPLSVRRADRRLRALVASGLLDSDPEAAFDRYTRLACRMLSVPVALVSLVTDTRQFFKSEIGLEGPAHDRRETPISHSFCRTVVDSEESLFVVDAREHPTLRFNPAIEELGVIAYAGQPIRNVEGLIFGALCVIDEIPRRWSNTEKTLLADLADAVSAEIMLRERILRERRQEEELQTAVSRLDAVRQRLSDQLRIQEETTAMVSHDLRTPLSALLLSVGLIERAEDPDDRQRLADRMRVAIHDMDELVGDLLDVVQINAGGIRYQFEPVVVRDIFERLAELHEAEAASREASLGFDDGGCELVADRRRVVQALSNLISNALRAAGSGGRVRVASRSEGETLQFTVADDGPGIEPARLKQLFERFVQGERAGSAGLGLAIAKGIAEGHGGSLSAESEPGQGAIFRLELPVSQ